MSLRISIYNLPEDHSPGDLFDRLGHSPEDLFDRLGHSPEDLFDRLGHSPEDLFDRLGHSIHLDHLLPPLSRNINLKIIPQKHKPENYTPKT